MPSNTWKRVSQKTVYKGRVQIIEHQVILPNGESSTYEVEHGEGGAVAVLIKTPDDQIMLAHQFRFPLNQWIYDLPGGGRNNNESWDEAATRECREELGIEPGKLQELAVFYPNPGRADWRVQLFYCEDYMPSQTLTNDPSESVETVLMPISRLRDLIKHNKIVDPSLLIAWHTASYLGYLNP